MNKGNQDDGAAMFKTVRKAPLLTPMGNPGIGTGVAARPCNGGGLQHWRSACSVVPVRSLKTTSRVNNRVDSSMSMKPCPTPTDANGGFSLPAFRVTLYRAALL